MPSFEPRGSHVDIFEGPQGFGFWACDEIGDLTNTKWEYHGKYISVNNGLYMVIIWLMMVNNHHYWLVVYLPL